MSWAGIKAEEVRGRNGEQNHVGTGICPEMQVEFRGAEQGNETHTERNWDQSQGRQDEVEGETSQMGPEEIAGSD